MKYAFVLVPSVFFPETCCFSCRRGQWRFIKFIFKITTVYLV